MWRCILEYRNIGFLGKVEYNLDETLPLPTNLFIQRLFPQTLRPNRLTLFIIDWIYCAGSTSSVTFCNFNAAPEV